MPGIEDLFGEGGPIAVGGLRVPMGALEAMMRGHGEDQVEIGRLTEDESKMFEEVESLDADISKLERQLAVKQSQKKAVKESFWLAVEERLSVPSNVGMTLNKNRTRIHMDREDAEKLNLPYTEISK